MATHSRFILSFPKAITKVYGAMQSFRCSFETLVKNEISFETGAILKGLMEPESGRKMLHGHL